MLFSILLCITSIILIYMEFFLPGGIMGTLGAVTFIASIVFYAYKEESMLFISMFIVSAIILLVATMKIALIHVKRTKLKSNIYLESDQEGYVASQYDSTIVGKKGIVLSDLRLSGYISVEGKRYQAVSKSEYIKKGSEIIVINGDGAHLIVQLLKKENYDE